MKRFTVTNSAGQTFTWTELDAPNTYYEPAFGTTYSVIETEVISRDQEEINKLAEKYLRDTDWYVIRFLDNGTEIPSDIKTERNNARQRIIR